MAIDASDNGLSGHTFASGQYLASLGADTELPFTDGGYANIANVAADLAYLGFDNVRDGITDGEQGSAALSTYITLAQEGIKFTFAIAAGGNQTTATLQAKLNLIDQVNEAVPGSIVAVEGANEINNLPITFNGETDDLQAAVDLQQALYAAVHSDPNLQGVAVDYFTGYDAYSFQENMPIQPGPDPATTPGLADFDTQHPYPAYGTPPDPTLTPSYSLQNENENGSTDFGPAVFTETGYSTNTSSGSGVDPDVQARYELDTLFDDAVNGISRTYIYQLLDAYPPGINGYDGYGLFDSNNMPKEAATAIHNLTSILADPAGSAAGFTPTQLNYFVSNLPSTGNTLALEKSTGAYDVVVYNEPEIWSEQTQTAMPAATQDVTVQLAATYATVEVFDPLSSAVPLETLSNVSSVELSLTDHPLIVELEVPCYCPGTLIMTERGEVAVERLAIGDVVVTAAGMLEPIRWIGRRSYAGAFIAGRHLMLPVCIRANAFADGVPHTDLSVSPGHAVLLDGQLVPAWRLVNGVSVVQADAVDEVTYIHLELGRHDILFANGALAESFLDDGCRGQFHNAAEFDVRHPGAPPMRPLAPRLEDGFALQCLQGRVAARAGVFVSPEPAGPLRGFVDFATPGQVRGWAQDAANPEDPVALDVLVDGSPVACVLANGYRADLRRVGLGSGCHGFALSLPAALAGVVVVRRVGDGAVLPLAETVSPGLRAA